MDIQFLFITDCPDCESMNTILNRAIRNSGVPCNVISYCCDEDENGDVNETALDIAVDNDFDDLPACIIGEYTFCGKDDYEYEDILEAIEKTWENQT